MLHSFKHTFIIAVASIFMLYSRLFAQVEPSKMKQFNITVNFENYTVKTQMLSQNKKIRLDNERTYLWYASQKLMETKGGFDGKLIHGTYSAFYLNNQLKEQGEIKYGLRNKEWKYWYPNGKLKEIITWKNGVKSGAYYLYNDYGQLMAKSNFKNDKLNGSFYTYGNNGAVIEKKKYKSGNEVQKKIKPAPSGIYEPKPQTTEPQINSAFPPEKEAEHQKHTKKKELPKKKMKKKSKPENSDDKEKKKIITS